MTTKKLSELRIKRSRPKPVSVKRDDLKKSDWYTAAAARFAISSAKDRHSDRDGGDGKSR